MSTRSHICRRNMDGSYDVIYCHFDGYPEGVGQTLYNHYQTEKKIGELLELGDVSALAAEIGVKHDFDDRSEETENMCNAYGRDRGEDGCESRTFTSEKELREMLKEAWTEWVYCWDTESAKWQYVSNENEHPVDISLNWKLLTPAEWEKESENEDV